MMGGAAKRRRWSVPRQLPQVALMPAEVAAVLGVSISQVIRLARRGVLERERDGSFPLATLARYAGRTARRDRATVRYRVKRLIENEVNQRGGK